MIETRVHNKKTKLTTLWTSNIPKRHKWNTIKAELYRAKRISLNFTIEVTLIRNKFKSAGYPMRFVNRVIHEFTTAPSNEDIELIIPPWFFEEMPYCLKNENSSKQLVGHMPRLKWEMLFN